MACSILTHLQSSNDFSANVVIGQKFNPSSALPIPQQFALVLVVIVGIVLISKNKSSCFKCFRILPFMGKISYSIFIWHQIVFAFFRNSIADSFSVSSAIIVSLFTLLLSFCSYTLIEKRVRNNIKTVLVGVIMTSVLLLASFHIYFHEGVTRDIAELDVVKGQEHRNMFGQYCDRIFQYNDFEGGIEKKKVIVVGVSFARDFANVLLESPFKDSIDLAYCEGWNNKGCIEKALSSDIVFSFSSKNDIPVEVLNCASLNNKVFGIGTKNYGSCNGIIYARRNSPNYYRLTNQIQPGYIELNNKWKKEWGDNYIDFITPVLEGEGRVRVFTDDNKYISQDCRHLTQAGAKYYARIIDWTNVFDN